MPFQIEIQNYPTDLMVSKNQLIMWATTALQSQLDSAELTIRLIAADEMQLLNHKYRQQNKPTNVLSFPSEIPAEIMAELELPYLGDIVICPAVIHEESREQGKETQFHWAHIVIHGVLHLLGYDHISDSDTEIMQNLEIAILTKLNFSNPYNDI